MKIIFSLSLIILFLQSPDYSQEVAIPKFSLKGGFYPGPQLVSLSPANASHVIYYTTDGSEPTDSSIKYISPVSISRTTVLRARSFLPDSLFSKTVTNTYFINEKTVLPVFSISTDPKNFWDKDSGIYVYPNYNNDWERPVHVEFYESDGSLGFSMDAGVKINGEGSRQFPQKSLALVARGSYGYGKIKYKMFPDLPIDEFENLLLRNAGGTEWNKTMFRDGLMQSLLKNTNVDVLAYRPCIVFINGEYFGIHNIGEKADEHYIQSHHNIDADSVYIMRYWGIQAERGGMACYNHYNSAEGFAIYTDLTKQSNYDMLNILIDIEEFTGYLVAQLFYCNIDWPDNNVKCWSPGTRTGIWRWILWDTDEGFDCHNNEAWKFPTLDYLTGTKKNPDFYVAPKIVKLINNLLKNESFKNSFINCLADFTNTFLRKDSLMKTISEFEKRIEPEVRRHLLRWDADPDRWYDNLRILETFAENRQPYIQQNFINKFNLKGTSAISLNTNDNKAGGIKLNSISVSRFPWKGNYFSGIPILITARPNPGYKFCEWQGVNEKTTNPLTLNPEADMTITAVFEPDSSFSNIVINEINYNSAPGFDSEDWVELFNASASLQDLSGWTFRDESPQHVFMFPENTTLGKGNYLVLCRDTLKFSQYFPEVKNRIGNFNFGLNNAGEFLSLSDKENNIIDSLTFNDAPPWPMEADGTGNTLELKNPLLGNFMAANWSASTGNGSPGRQNTRYTGVETKGREIQSGYLIFQCYPNPFNPETTLSYSIPVQAFVEIIIYDILGRLVTRLVSKEQEAGEYKVRFNGENLTSGTYIAIIKAGEYLKLEKLLLLK